MEPVGPGHPLSHYRVAPIERRKQTFRAARIEQAELAGISMCIVPGCACYVPLGHRDVFGALVHDQLAEGEALARLKPLLEASAKTVNFGIIYGIGPRGLSEELGITKKEARDYINKYLDNLHGVLDYIETTKASARKSGVITTMLGRRCHYPDINSLDDGKRSYSERQAVNATIQGSAADILRIAMIAMDGALKEVNLSAKMMLQVHDELVFEVPDGEVGATIEVVRRIIKIQAQ